MNFYKKWAFLPFVGIFFACGSNDNGNNETPIDTNVPTIEAINYTIVQSFPHDPAAFTQGLIWHNGYLYEGTGQFKESNLRKVNLEDGKVVQEVKNKDDIFGEGITILHGKIYQISWQNHKAFVYDAASLKLLQEFDIKTEGWGITTNGKELIMSDGSSNLYFLDPNSFAEIRRVGVTSNLGYVADINELEFINGFVYANQWRTNYIVKINPDNGKVEGRIDLSNLKSMVQNTLRDPENEVLNGIAYDSTNNRLFVTGKYWPQLFEIKLQ